MREELALIDNGIDELVNEVASNEVTIFIEDKVSELDTAKEDNSAEELTAKLENSAKLSTDEEDKRGAEETSIGSDETNEELNNELNNEAPADAC